MSDLSRFITENETLVSFGGLTYVVKDFTPHGTATVYRIGPSGERTRVFYTVAQNVICAAAESVVRLTHANSEGSDETPSA